MNIDRLIQARIPDIYSIYGGARGRTMSSRHQLYAWPALVESGVRTVIDLRAADRSDRLPVLCEEYGMRYFHYPVDNAQETISSMVALFPEFCSIIDEGDFYVACAMGLHRTDTALHAYWMFHGADNGIPQPELHGYLQEKRLTTDKMMRILNAFYKLSVERNSYFAISPEVFKERKQAILSAWRNNQ